MPAQLVALNDGPSILLDKPILLLGRHPECDIQIDSRKISRRHCCIAQVSDYLIVRDLGSTNGVRINGVRVTEGRLTAGDELTIGNHRYQVTWDEDVVAPSPIKDALPKLAQIPPRPSPEHQTPDDFLESSEQPIPLRDPDPTPLRGPFRPNKLDKPSKKDKPKPSSPTEIDESIILPDHLNLAPDIFPTPGSSPSHH